MPRLFPAHCFEEWRLLVNPIALLATVALLFVAGYLLARRRWWIGTEFVAASLVIGLWTGPTVPALAIWLVLAGLVAAVMAAFRRSAPKEH